MYLLLFLEEQKEDFKLMSMLQCMKVYWKYDWKGLRKQEGFLPSAVGHHLPRPNNLPSLPSGVAGTHLWKISTPNRSGGGFCFFNHKAYGIHWNQLSEKERTFVKIPSASFFGQFCWVENSLKKIPHQILWSEWIHIPPTSTGKLCPPGWTMQNVIRHQPKLTPPKVLL